MVINLLHSTVPIDTASFLENLRSRTQVRFRYKHFFLRNGFHGSVQNGIYGFKHQVTPQHHQLVINNFHIIRIGNRYLYLLDNLPGIDFMFQEEGSNTCFRITIHDRPIDRSSSSILRQQRCMQIKRSHGRHVPYHFRQHSESHYNLQIGL